MMTRVQKHNMMMHTHLSVASLGVTDVNGVKQQAKVDSHENEDSSG